MEEGTRKDLAEKASRLSKIKENRDESRIKREEDSSTCGKFGLNAEKVSKMSKGENGKYPRIPCQGEGPRSLNLRTDPRNAAL